MSVGVVVVFDGTCLFLTVVFPFNWNFREGWQLGFIRVCGLVQVLSGGVGGISFFLRVFTKGFSSCLTIEL